MLMCFYTMCAMILMEERLMLLTHKHIALAIELT